MARWNFICQTCFYERINDGRYLPDVLGYGECVLCGDEGMGTSIGKADLDAYYADLAFEAEGKFGPVILHGDI